MAFLTKLRSCHPSGRRGSKVFDVRALQLTLPGLSTDPIGSVRLPRTIVARRRFRNVGPFVDLLPLYLLAYRQWIVVSSTSVLPRHKAIGISRVLPPTCFLPRRFPTPCREACLLREEQKSRNSLERSISAQAPREAEYK